MKKIIALSLLSSLVGCAQLMPPKTPLQTPIETINTNQTPEKFVEPTIVAELDASVKTDPLYQSIDSIAVSEQVIEQQPIAQSPVSVESTEPVNTAIDIDTAAEADTATEADTTADVDTAAESDTVTEADTAADVDTATEADTATDVDTATTDAINTESAMAAALATNGDSLPITDETTVTDPNAVMVTEPTMATEPTTDTIEIAEPEPIDPAMNTEVDDLTLLENPITDDDYQIVDMDGYSVQITASRDENALATLLLFLDSQQPAWINKKMINGSQVYTLLLGHYSNHDQAKAALELLPQAIQQNGAFVRNFYEIEHTRSPQLKQLQ